MSTDLEFRVPLNQIVRLASIRLKPLAEADLNLAVWRRVTSLVSDLVFEDEKTISTQLVNFLMTDIGVYDCSVLASMSDSKTVKISVALKIESHSKMDIQTYEIRYN